MSINYSSSKNHGVHANLALTANGTTNASTTVIPPSSLYSEITTCTNAAHAVVLPEHPLSQMYHIVNKGAHQCTLFPHSDGTSTIDGAASFVLGNNGCSVSLFPATIGPAASNAQDVTWHSFNKSGKSVIATTAAVTILNSVNYPTQVHVSQAAAYAITIGDPEDCVGQEIDIFCEVEGANSVTISSGSADLSGIILLGDAAGIIKVIDQDTTMSMVATHCQIGDVCKLVSDGTNWSCMIQSQSLDANDGWVAS